MAGRHVVDAVDRTLKDLIRRSTTAAGDELPFLNELPAFGGKLIIFSGDMRQILPVVRHAGRAGTIAELVKNSHLFQSYPIEEMHLTINERVLRNNNTPEGRQFAQYLLDVGDGKPELYEPSIGNSMTRIPDNLVFSGSVTELIQWAYPGLETTKEIDIEHTAILSPKNKTVSNNKF